MMEVILNQLTLQIVGSKVFDAKDRPTLKEVISSLLLDGVNVLSDVNDTIKRQVRIEAGIVYLLGKYEDKQQESENDLAELEAEVVLSMPSMDDDGRKLTVEHRRVLHKYGVVADPAMQRARRSRDSIKALNRDLGNIARVVFSRNAKLEHLSNNYRREMKSDDNQE